MITPSTLDTLTRCIADCLRGRDHRAELADLRDDVDELEAETERLQDELDDARSRVDDLQAQLPPDPPEVETEIVDNAFVEDAIAGIDGFDERAHRNQMNNEYRVTTREGLQQILEHDATDLREYVREYYDCVDFAGTFRFNVSRRYRINSIGTVITEHGTRHAFNVIVFADGSAELLEPQSDKFVVPESSDLYRMRDAYWLV